MLPLILPADQEESILHAAKTIRAGGVVVVPTESFYGLAVNPLNERSIERLIAIKKRREDHPVLILIHATEVLLDYAVKVPPVARELIKAFWPGGLTLVFHATSALPSLLTGGTGKIGVRLSSHPAATALARAAGVAITGTSANLTGEPPCTAPEEVLEALGSEVDIILDGGKTAGGRGSTVLDVTLNLPLILREGLVSRKSLAPFLEAS